MISSRFSIGESTPEKTVLSSPIEKKLSLWELLWYKYIVIHHTATSTWTTIATIEKNFNRTYWRQAAHYIIDYNWEFKKVLEIDKNAWSTRNNGINNYAIQIEMIWNFDIAPPSIDQYKSLQYLINEIEKKKWKLEIIPHRDASASSCPWSLIDMTWVITWLRDYKFKEEKKKIEYIKYNKTDWVLLWTFRITQYHPCIWSSINDSAAQWWSCDVAASWLPLINDYAWKVVACPPEFSIWRAWTKREKLMIEWLWIVECVDRWWSIKWKHLDLFVWVWEVWKANFDSWKFKEWVWYRKVRYVE